MEDVLRQFVVLASVTGFMGVILAILIQRPFLFVAMFFLLFNFCLRIVSLAYIDLTGPVYSLQLFRAIGPGMATPIYVAAYLVVLVPIVFLFSPGILKVVIAQAKVDAPLPSARISLADVIFYASLAFVLAVYADMLRIGVIPLLAKMERTDYLRDHAGVLHKLLVEHGFLLVFIWGCLFSYTWIHRRAPDLRFALLLLVVMIYLFLTGNRFSAFYSLTSYFAIPVAAVLIANLNRPRQTGHYRISRGLGWVLAGLVLLLVLIVAALANSYLVVRTAQPEGAALQFLQRVFVQPSELAWLTYERVFVKGHGNSQAAAQFLFWYPLDTNRNTTIQYLMVLPLGYEVAKNIIDSGSQYAGGFPEIFFELFGVYFAWPMLAIAGIVTGALLLILLRAVIYGHFLTALLAAYVLFGVFVMYIGGMLNFVVPWTYWAKILALGLCIALERSWDVAGLRIVPWRIVAGR